MPLPIAPAPITATVASRANAAVVIVCATSAGNG
jgi:hypothetical protein